MSSAIRSSKANMLKTVWINSYAGWALLLVKMAAALNTLALGTNLEWYKIPRKSLLTKSTSCSSKFFSQCVRSSWTPCTFLHLFWCFDSFKSVSCCAGNNYGILWNVHSRNIAKDFHPSYILASCSTDYAVSWKTLKNPGRLKGCKCWTWTIFLLRVNMFEMANGILIEHVMVFGCQLKWNVKFWPQKRNNHFWIIIFLRKARP